jgi:predicted transcriptional regulator YheO
MSIVKFKSKSKGFIMLTERDLKSHDDYENFAKYLGIDYEDYCELVLDVVQDELELVGISNAYYSNKKR